MNAFALSAGFGPLTHSHDVAAAARLLWRWNDARRLRSGAVRSALRALLAAALLATTLHAARAGTVYYVDLVNASPSAIVAFDVARPGSDRFRSVLPERAPLQGDGAAATIAIRKGDSGCLRDVRVRFADGRSRTHRYLDLCAAPALDFEL